jgi:hypothetical protein
MHNQSLAFSSSFRPVGNQLALVRHSTEALAPSTQSASRPTDKISKIHTSDTDAFANVLRQRPHSAPRIRSAAA